MGDLFWWIGVIHVAFYVIAGSIFAMTWLMWRTVGHLNLWRDVFRGLKYHRALAKEPTHDTN